MSAPLTPAARARAVVQSIVSIYPSTVGIIGPDYEPGQRLVAAIAAALLDAERRVWERVIKYCEEEAQETQLGRVGSTAYTTVADWCEAAQVEETPR